jgi:hypothetical protein
MDDRRVAWLRARIAAPRSEAARLEVEVDAVLAARAVGVSQWRSDPMLFQGWAALPKELLAKVLELLQWQPAVCSAVRAVCSAWGDVHDEYCRTLQPRGSLAVMEGKLGWYRSVTAVDLTRCEKKDVSGVLAEVKRMPSLRSLSLPPSCAEQAVDADKVCGLATLTTLRFKGSPVSLVAGEWVLDLSRLTTLTTLHLVYCSAVTDKQVLALSHLTGLTILDLWACRTVTAEGLRAVSNLASLSSLSLAACRSATSEVLRAVSSLTALSTLTLTGSNAPCEGLRAVIK